MVEQRKRLGDLLIEENIITDQQLNQALESKRSDQKLGDVLVTNGYITEQQLIEILEFQLGIPRISLFNYSVDATLTSLIKKEFALKNLIFPIKQENGKLFVAMADPLDFYSIEDIRLSTGFEVELSIAAREDIIRAIHRYYELDTSVDEIMEETQIDAANDAEVLNSDSPMVKLVDELLLRAVQERASDVHIDVHETQTVIRYRIDGVLRTERVLPKQVQNMLIARVKIMGNLDITESRIPQDGRIKITIDGNPIDLRISSLPTVYGEKIVMRILALDQMLNDLTRLDFSKKHLSNLTDMIAKPNGIVLITGPTGSGKSSTLYAILNKLNKDTVNIITIEDPVEYQLEGINQVHVNTKVGMSFANGLRSILRQDPDVIMIGEIRDEETAEIAVRASLTGHLVLSTIHTNDSISTINRLTDMNIEPFLLAASLSGIISQRLVRRICRDCKTERSITEREKIIFSNQGVDISTIYHGEGCSTCNMTGYRGRIAIHEMLVVDQEIQEMIMNGASSQEIKRNVLKKEMSFLIKDGLEKVKQGLTTTEEILRVASESR